MRIGKVAARIDQCGTWCLGLIWLRWPERGKALPTAREALGQRHRSVHASDQETESTRVKQTCKKRTSVERLRGCRLGCLQRRTGPSRRGRRSPPLCFASLEA